MLIHQLNCIGRLEDQVTGQRGLVRSDHVHAARTQSGCQPPVLRILIHEQTNLAHDGLAVWPCCDFSRSNSASSLTSS